MERPLRQKPSPYPGAVAWSRDNILAVGQERSVALLNPADLVNGDAGFVHLADDTAAGNHEQDAAFPADIENLRRNTDALAMRGMLHRPTRPEVAARQVAWSPVWDVKEKNTPPRSVLLVVSTTHAVTVHAPSTRDTRSEWVEICDLSRLEREAREREDDAEDAAVIAAAAADPTPAPRAPRKTSAQIAQLLRDAAALPALPATPATPAVAAAATPSLPAPEPAREPSPPPPNALDKGVQAEVDRGDREWLPATVEEVLGQTFGPFRVKVRYDVAPAKDAEAEWLVFEESAALIVSRIGADGRRDERIASHFAFPKATAAAVGNVTGKSYRLRPRSAPDPRPIRAAGAGDPKPELADARPFAAHSNSDSDDDAPVAKLAAAAAPDLTKPAAKRARAAAPAKGAEKMKDVYAETLSHDARDAARAAVEEAAARGGGNLAPADAAATATKAVFEKARADEKTLACVATTGEANAMKRARNDALVALALRARDAFLEARAGAGIDAVYAKGKHIKSETADGKCLDATIKTAEGLIACAMKAANVKGSMRSKDFEKQAKIAVREEVGEPSGANPVAAAPPPRAAAAAVVVDDSGDDDDDEPIIDLARSPRPATRGSRTPVNPVCGSEVAPPRVLSGTGAIDASHDASSLRRAERLAALCAAWSGSSDAAGASLVAVGAKSGDVTLWSARTRALPKGTDAEVGMGIEVCRLGSTRVADAWVTALAWADDDAERAERRLVVGASDGSVAAWRVREPSREPSRPPLERTDVFCEADGVTITTLAVDASGTKLVAAGNAAGAVSVFHPAEAGALGLGGEKKTTARVSASRVFFEPVAGAAWRASPRASGASRLVVTSTSGRSSSMDATIYSRTETKTVTRRGPEPEGAELSPAFELSPASVVGPAPLRVPGAAAPDGADVPAEFHAGLAASPAGVFVARVRAFHNPATASFSAKGNEKDGKMQIAARMRRGAVVLEPTPEESPATRATALERAVARAASGANAAASLGSLWDVRAAADAIGTEGHAAVVRGVESAKKRAGRDEEAKARAARIGNALASARAVSLPGGAPEGLACRACGAREDSAGSASRWCASCGLPLRAALESTMGLKSVVI